MEFAASKGLELLKNGYPFKKHPVRYTKKFRCDFLHYISD